MGKRRFLGKGGGDREKARIALLLEVLVGAEGAPLFPGMRLQQGWQRP